MKKPLRGFKRINNYAAVRPVQPHECLIFGNPKGFLPQLLTVNCNL